MIDPDLLPSLAEPVDHAVSIYFPISPEQRDVRAPGARLRGLVDQADRVLARSGLDEQARASLLAPARRAESTDFSAHRDPGLGLFLGGGRTDTVSLPEAPPELVVVGRHFHVKPLIPLLARNRRFYILALSASRARACCARRLLRGRMWRLPSCR